MMTITVLGSLTVGLQAYDQVERIQDMQTMEASMAQIQKGILYNNNKMVLQGVENLKQASSKVEVTEKTDMDYSSKFAKQKASNIIKFADKIKISIEENHRHAASSHYTEVLKECVSCHNKIRKWSQ